MKQLTLTLSSTFLLASSLLVQAGPWEPPGPPRPTMRTPVFAEDLPLNITSPGSYFLADDITTAGQGITISADNVTLDLMGFSFKGGLGNGISATSNTKNITVRNGSVSGWSGSGVSLTGTSHCQVIDVVAVDNAGWGIATGPYSQVVRSTAEGNGSGIELESGIFTMGRSRLSACVAQSNDGFGILSGSDTIVSDSFSIQNTRHGIVSGTGSLIVDSVSNMNAGSGIVVSSGVVRNCMTKSNGENGIDAGVSSFVVGNNSSENSSGAGVSVFGSCRVESNHVTANNQGIYVLDVANTIFKNTAQGNSQDYVILNSTNNDVGPIGSAESATSAWANIVNP